MGSNTLDQFKLICIIEFLCSFKLTCNTNGIGEDTAIWVYIFFTKNSAKSALRVRQVYKHKARTWMPSAGETTTITAFPQVIDYFFCTYTTDEKISEIEGEMTMFTHLSNKTPSQCAKTLVAKALFCNDVYEELYHNDIFMNGVIDSVRKRLREYWISRQSVSLQDLAFHTEL